MYTILKLTDWHVPFHDMRALNVAFNFVEEVEPREIILDEVIDFYAISKFDRDPKRKTQLQRELDMTQDILWKLRKRFPDLTMIMVESNHDRRLKKYLRSTAPELESLRFLDFSYLMGLEDLRIKYLPFYVHKKILFKHGDLVKKHSGATARGEFDKEGMSGMSGHSHRAGSYEVTLRGGRYKWVECGCLCKTKNVEYVEGTANWQQAIGLVVFEDDGSLFKMTYENIIDYKMIWANKIITV